MDNKNDREYYKAILDLLKLIIAPLFVSLFGLIGYCYTTNDIMGIYALLLDFMLWLFFVVVYIETANNLRD